MREKLEEIKSDASRRISGTQSIAELQDIKVEIVGKKGSLTQLLRSMGNLPAEERPAAGQMVNEARQHIEDQIEKKENVLGCKEKDERLLKEKLDISLPAKRKRLGSLHPLTLVNNEIIDLFIGMGFEIKEGPEIDYDKYCFEMLNIPKNHPARDMQDTFYVTENIVLRPHTSPVQIHTMLEQKPPIRMISPGRVYRSDDVDATHSPVFNQLEALVIDKGVTFGDLKGSLDTFAKGLFGPKTKTRFRPGHFPFTEPSAEVDVTCSACEGKGCRVCKGAGWIEVLGSGMVHPNVLRACGIDPDVYSGFAFGLGIDRIATIKYGISDIRLLSENDTRFLSQFRG